MITSTNGSMELIIAEPVFLPSLLKSHHYYHESSGYSSKEAECSSPENKIHDVKLRIHRNKPVDIHRRRPRISPSTTPMSNTNSLTINESLPVRIKS
jgi:hypothetical protein